MPWCEQCDRYHAPTAMNDDGTCPTCGGAVAADHVTTIAHDESAPWHFKLLVAATVGYLAWRLVQVFI